MSYYPTSQMAMREPRAFKQGIFSGLGAHAQQAHQGWSRTKPHVIDIELSRAASLSTAGVGFSVERWFVRSNYAPLCYAGTCTIDAKRGFLVAEAGPGEHADVRAVNIAKEIAQGTASHVGAVVRVRKGGSVIFTAHPGWPVRGTHGLGQDPLSCPPPKWTYDSFMNRCACAVGYAPTPDGRDCIPLVGQGPDEATGPLETPEPVPPGPAPAPAPQPAACDGTSIAGHCVPTWALIGGGLVVGIVLLKVL
jgi:hypothetical protein